MDPLVSIITPSYNQGQFLEATIQSVLSQDYPHLEYIIVDGGSTDDSVEIIQRYADRLTWWISERDQGHADALNKGFGHANGEIYAWLNSDDTYQPGAIREAVNYLLSHPDISMVYSDANLIDENGKIMGRFPARQTDYSRMLAGSVNIPQATTFFWGRRLKQAGPLDLTLQYAFDYDLWVRLAKISPVAYVPHTWANFRIHALGKTVYLDDRCYPEMLRVSQRELGRSSLRLKMRWYVRRLTYAWLPTKWRVQLRQWLRF